MLAVLAAGCGGETGRDAMAPVSGRVTYAGRPVTAGRIIFYPEDGRRMAMSAIDASGNYALTTFESQDGAFLGKYKVVVDAVREIASGPATPENEGANKLQRLVPVVYADHTTSPLAAEVVADGNTIDFDIPK
jgi:hypothetical protein